MAAALAGLPTVSTPGFRFDRTTLTARVGETVELRLDNTHSTPHSFDVDELDVHVAVAPDTSALVRFTPTVAGTYAFYCAVPGHRVLGMAGTLTVAP